MRFYETSLPGAWLIEPARVDDERGHFARTFDREQWEARGMDPLVVQCSTSFNLRAGTLRGMHLQAEPHQEPKLIRVTRGALFDVLVDLRVDSPTHRRWYGVELSAANGRMLFAPRGLAHGFQTLVDATEVSYQIGAAYAPHAAIGIRWDDPLIDVAWPPAPASGRTIGPRDLSWPLLDG